MKQIAKLCTFVLLTMLMCALTIPAFAAGTVTYDGDADKFIFAPGGEESPTNLFGDFQNVMPGDTRTEQIVIQNDTSNKVKIKVYLRSQGAQADTEDFLSQLNLTVRQKDDSVLFAAPADETAQLTDWVYLGTVYSGGKITLDVTLEVPITLSDEYQDEVGYVDWEFKIEELPVSPSDPNAPKTGDSNDVFLYFGMLVISVSSLALLLYALKRRGKKED